MTNTNIIKAYAAHEAAGKLQPFEYKPDALGKNGVEIQVHYCGICHSDLSMIDNEWGMSQYPLVAGHEVVGKVLQIGDDVQNLAVGDMVGLGWHCNYCGNCDMCLSGDHNLCASGVGTIVGHHGGFADKVRADAKAVVKLPKGIDFKVAGPLMCGGITVFNPLVQFGIAPTSKVAVIGIGGLGHMALQFLNAWGCEVTAFTSHKSKEKELLKLGAHKVLDSTNAKELEGAAASFDMILSTVNVKLDWNLYIQTLKPKGRFHFVGATLEPLDISVFGLITGQRSISASPVGSPTNIKKMLEFANFHDIKPQVEIFPLSKVNDALDHLRAGKARYRVVLKADAS